MHLDYLSLLSFSPPVSYISTLLRLYVQFRENIGGVLKFGVYIIVVMYVDDGTYRPLEHVGWTVQCCSRARACGLDSVVLYRHVGWTVGDNRGSTEQKQMAPTSEEEGRVLAGSTDGGRDEPNLMK